MTSSCSVSPGRSICSISHQSWYFYSLKDAGLTAKLGKYQFSMAECSYMYLGYHVGNGHIRVERSKVEAVSAFPVPKTKKESYIHFLDSQVTTASLCHSMPLLQLL